MRRARTPSYFLEELMTAGQATHGPACCTRSFIPISRLPKYRIVALKKAVPKFAKLRVERTFLLSIGEDPGIASALRSPCVFPYPENFIGRSLFGRAGFIGIRFAVSFSRADRAWE
jgi:hypothetical protein